MRLIFLLTFLTFSYTLFSQDTTTIEQYCEVVVTPIYGISTVNIIMDYGKEKYWWSGYKDKKSKYVKSSVIEALNYMGKQGWKLVNTITIPVPLPFENDRNEYHYFFRKEFVRSPLNDQRTN